MKKRILFITAYIIISIAVTFGHSNAAVVSEPVQASVTPTPAFERNLDTENRDMFVPKTQEEEGSHFRCLACGGLPHK